MTLSLKVLETLIWHDFPQLFVAKDKIGGLYLCLAIDELPSYVAVAISSARLQELKTRKIDLYSALSNPELGAWFSVRLNESDDIVATSLTEPIPSSWLPLPDVFLPTIPLLSPETFEVVKVSAVAKEAGMNPTLLRQYLSGVKKPSREQALKVQNALHSVGQKLLSVQFV